MRHMSSRKTQICHFPAFWWDFGNVIITISCAIHLATYWIQKAIFHQIWRYEVLKEQWRYHQFLSKVIFITVKSRSDQSTSLYMSAFFSTPSLPYLTFMFTIVFLKTLLHFFNPVVTPIIVFEWSKYQQNLSVIFLKEYVWAVNFIYNRGLQWWNSTVSV